MLAGGSAQAATSVTSEAAVSPGQPAGHALRLVLRITDDAAPAPGTAERVAWYLPSELRLQGDGFPRCAIETIRQSGAAACPAGSQLGSGAVKGKLGPSAQPIEFAVSVVNGAVPGTVILDLSIATSGTHLPIEGMVLPSDDPAFGSMLVLPIATELQQPVPGIYHAITDIDVLLHATGAAPYVAIAGCPQGSLGFKAVVSFNPAAPAAPAGPLSSTASAACPPPAPGTTPPDRAVAEFGVRLKRKHGAVRRLRLTGVTPGAVVSVRCLRRCGGRGGELKKSVRGGTVRLKRPLRPRSRFELRVGEPGLVARFARYRVDRRGRTRTLAGCRDASGAKRACPAG